MANTYLQRNMANSLDSVYTISMWVKRCEVSRQQMLFSAYNNSTYDTECFFDGDKINWRNKRNGSFTWQKKSNAKFRDTNSFYHFVFQNNQSNRKIYVNGVEITSWETNTDGSGASTWNNDKSHAIGSTVNGGADHFNGIISHMHFASGTSLAPTVFGSVDSVTGEWQINTSPSFTPGANGFTILKDGNTITDQSSNSNNWSSNGAGVTTTKDCPSNNFPTFITASHSGSYTFYNGATTSFGNGTSDWSKATIGTLGASDGKYYWEIKLGMNGGATDYNITGVVRSDKVFSNSNVYSNGGFNGLQSANAAGGLGIYSQTGASMGGALYIGGSSVNLTNGAIVMYALDLDNKKMWVGKNGTWANAGSGGGVGNPATGANPLWGTGEFTTGATYLPGNIQYQTSDCSYNFGNGYFKTTAVASAGTNASGNGIFEYNVPSGFTALSTKGLNL